MTIGFFDENQQIVAIYSIKDLETLSGIKAHTIRIWEKRYNLLSPQRTETNIRYYVDEDVKLLLNAALLNRNGYKISRIARMESSELHDAVRKLSEDTFDTDVQSDALTIAMLELDEESFDRTIFQRIQEIGFSNTMTQVIFPFLDRLNVLWLTGSIKPVHENYIAGLIKQKIYVALDKLPHPKSSDGTFITYIPEGEDHELSMLFIQYLLKEKGYKVINLGHSTSLDDLQLAYELHSPQYIFTIINEGRFRESVKDYVEKISLLGRKSTVLLTGLQISQQRIRNFKNCITFEGLSEIIAFLETLDHKFQHSSL